MHRFGVRFNDNVYTNFDAGEKMTAIFYSHNVASEKLYTKTDPQGGITH